MNNLSFSRLSAGVVLLVLFIFSTTQGQAQLYWNTNNSSAATLWTSANWATTSGGTASTAWASSSNVVFNTSSANSGTNLLTFATATVGNITVNADTTITSGGTLSTKTGGSTINVASGKTLSWSGQSWSSSGTQIFTKSGAGTWNIGAQANALAAGSIFTLSDGAVVMNGINSFGGANATLNLNGGTIVSSSTTSKTFANSVVNIQGNFQYGDMTLGSAANLTFGGAGSTGTLGSGATRVITLATTNNRNLNFQQSLSGSGSGLSFVGASATETNNVYLSGNNTFDGGITLANAYVYLGATGGFGSSNVITLNGGANAGRTRLRMDGRDATIAGITSGASTDTGALFGNYAGTGLNSVVTIDTANGSLNNFYGSVTDGNTGTLTVVKNGAGTQVFQGNGFYSGSTTLNAGTLGLGSSIALGTGNLIINGGTLAAVGLTRTLTNSVIVNNNFTAGGVLGSLTGTNLNLTGNVDLAGGTRTITRATNLFTMSGVVSNGGLNLVGNTGNINLAGSNNIYTGGTTIGDGITTQIAAADGLGTASTLNSSYLVLKGGSGLSTDSSSSTTSYAFSSNRGLLLGATNSAGYGARITVNTNSSGLGSMTWAGVVGNISGEAGSLIKSGGGSLTLNGNNTYSGGTLLSGGLLNIGNANALGSGKFTMSSATFDNTSGGDLTLGISSMESSGGSMTFLGTSSLNTGSGQVSFLGDRNITVSANTLTFGGAVVGSSKALTKLGAGTLQLNGANTYSGATTVSAGSLLVTAGGSITNSAATVNGGTLTVNGTAGAVTVNTGGSLGGSGTLGAVTLNSGSLLNPGNSPGTLTAASAVWNGGAIYNFQINALTGTAGTAWDLFSVGGLLNATGVNSANRFNLVVTKDGSFAGWGSANQEYAYTFAQAASLSGLGGVYTAGTDISAYFNVTTSGFTGGAMPNSGYNASGDWKVVVGGTSAGVTALNLMAVPEPSAGLLFGVGLVALVITRRLNRKT